MTNKALMKLSNEDLVKRYQGGKDQGTILGILYYNNTGLIRQIANKFTGYETIEDLMQESFFGIKTAAELYDSTGEAKFSTYAAIWIQQAMRRYIDSCGSCVRIPTHAKSQIYRYSQIKNKYVMDFGREPTESELVKLLGVNAEILRKIQGNQIGLRLVSLDAPLMSEDGDGLTIGDTIPGESDQESNIINIIDNERLELMLWDQVDALEDTEREIIKTRYKENLTVKEAADRIGCTEQAAKGAEAKAMRKLRKNKKISILREEYMTALAYHQRGVSTFFRTHTSITEHAALKQLKQL